MITAKTTANKFTERVIDLAFEGGLVLYPGAGFVDGVNARE